MGQPGTWLVFVAWGAKSPYGKYLAAALCLLYFPVAAMMLGGFGVGSMAQSRHLFIARNVEVRYRGGSPRLGARTASCS